MLLCFTVRTPVVAATQPPASEAVFRTLILERIRAYGHGDVRTYLGMLTDDFVHVSDLGARRTKERMRAFVGGHGDNRASYDIATLAWRTRGDVAIVDAEVREHQPHMEGRLHETDIFVPRAGRWLYQYHQETAVWQPPARAAVSVDPLEDYAGRYEAPGGTRDIITVKDGRLFDRASPGDVPAAFVQIARGAFGFAADPDTGGFLRDRSGKVRQCLWHLPSGQTIVSRRLE